MLYYMILSYCAKNHENLRGVGLHFKFLLVDMTLLPLCLDVSGKKGKLSFEHLCHR